MGNPHISAEELSLVPYEMERNINRTLLRNINERYEHLRAPTININETDFTFRLYLFENVMEIDNADVERDTI